MTLPHLLHAVRETVRISAPTVLDATLGRLTPEVCDARLERWSQRLLERARVELVTSGIENAPRDEAFIVMSNHQSLYDIPVVYQALRRRLRMVAKKELFRVPLWGAAMRRAGFIAIDRSNRAAAIASLEAAKGELERGTSIWIAPEGTRSQTGVLGEFKQGGFHLAIETGARILPLTIDGTREVLPAHGKRVRDGVTVRVTVHPPIDAVAYGNERRAELVAAVRRAIESGLEPNAPRPSPPDHDSSVLPMR
ncbi:MAG: lysophospholipid acyltransferase family protein [Pseudomonadota bacterium]|nr:MAG: 1-acyl-sn-glycerol-3-phosphate acyltransferase [Pseudomonadota bacterium]